MAIIIPFRIVIYDKLASHKSRGRPMEKSFQKLSITGELAFAMIRAAEKRAGQIGIRISITIVDESGVLKAFSRMDNAPMISIGTSKKKALTAVGFGLASGSTWYNIVKDDPSLLHGVQNIDDFILLGGGLPIRVDNSLIGAIGVSGGNTKQDEECSLAALEVLSSNPE
jgi:uncharacterized protein GlcG (DUF336 family)